MTQVAILKKSEVPEIQKIVNDIQSQGYDFEIKNREDGILSGNGLQCAINGQDTYFETDVTGSIEFVEEFEFIKSDLTDEDIAIIHLGSGFCCRRLYWTNFYRTYR